MDASRMRTFIQNFSFDDCRHGNQGYNRLLIQLFGYTGHGKSSFINSCKYVMDDVYHVHAKVASSQDKPETMRRNAYPLTNSITLVDNRGCARMDRTAAAEICAQLGNFHQLGTEVTWHEGYEETLKDLMNTGAEDRSGDFITPIFVYSATKIIADQEVGDLREILTKAADITGIFPAVVLTHETSEHLPDIKEKFRRMGAQLIVPIENYTQEDNMKIRRKHEKILKCLTEIIKDVEFRMTEIRDPGQEMKRRKRILNKFLIQREIAKVQDDLARTESELRRRESEFRERESEFRRRESEFSERERFLEEKLRKEKVRGDRQWWDGRAFR